MTFSCTGCNVSQYHHLDCILVLDSLRYSFHTKCLCKDVLSNSRMIKTRFTLTYKRAVTVGIKLLKAKMSSA